MMNNIEAMVEKKKKGAWAIPIFSALVLIVGAAAYIVYKIGEYQANEKWKDYDDCGWS